MSDSEDAASTPSSDDTPPQWLDELREAALALRELAQAQWQLLGAELRLARMAASMLLVAVVLAAACAAALGLVLLALLGVALAYWFGSWIWSLVALAVLLILAIAMAAVFARRCLHWLSLPGTRAQWHSIARRTTASRRMRTSTGEESADDETDSQAG